MGDLSILACGVLVPVRFLRRKIGSLVLQEFLPHRAVYQVGLRDVELAQKLRTVSATMRFDCKRKAGKADSRRCLGYSCSPEH